VKYVSDALADRTIFNNKAQHWNVPHDRTAIPHRAAPTILFIGLIIDFIAEILQIVAFFSIPEQMPMGPQQCRDRYAHHPSQAQCCAFRKRT